MKGALIHFDSDYSLTSLIQTINFASFKLCRPATVVKTQILASK